VPLLGTKKLDAITSEAVQRLKLALAHRAPKTVNNVLTVLSTLLKRAVEWGEVETMPCMIRLLPNPKKTMGFHDFAEYERLLIVAQKRGSDTYLMVLLGGDAGLRLGEIVALEWTDVDFHARRLTVQRSDWCGQVTVPKGGRSRRLPMTQRLTSALNASRHMRSRRVLCLPDGAAITRDRVIKAIRGSQRVAGLPEAGVHVLRHHADSRIMPTALGLERDRGGDRALPKASVGMIRGAREMRGVDQVGGSDPASRPSASFAPAPAL
jgi:integrase